MVDYSLGKIYKLIGSGLTYYGSTCQTTLSRRLSGHVGDYKNKIKHHTSSYIIIEQGNYSIILVESFPCKTKDELHARERFYIEGNECINKVIPARTKEESAVMYKEYKKKYRETHKESAKEYRDAHKEYNKEYKKEFYLKNKDNINEKRKKYRDAHKEEQKTHSSEKFICNCGGKYTMGHKSTHFKSKKHLNYINQESAMSNITMQSI
jgi:hypothetical protein